MHYAKYGKVAVGSILMHSDRGIDSPDTHEHSNENIDRSKTRLNYDLKERDGQTAYAYYKQRIDWIAAETKERTGKSIRKDAVTLCSWAVTAPKDLPEDKQADFFRAAYEWFSERYGADNIVTAAVHMDENTPHMHLQFTPIIEKDGVRKLCAKDIETRRTFATAHQKLQKHLERALGCEVNILNGATERGNKSILELQNDTLKKQLAEKKEKVRQVEERTQRAVERLKAIEGKILKQEEINAIEGKKTLTGALKGVTYVEYLSLKKTALEVKKMEKECKKLVSERDSAIEYAKKAVEEVKRKSISVDLERAKEMSEYVNQNKLLKKALGISENASSDQIQRFCKNLSAKAKNKNLVR